MTTPNAAHRTARTTTFLYQPLAVAVTFLALCAVVGIGLAATSDAVRTRAILRLRGASADDASGLEALAQEIRSEPNLLETLQQAVPSTINTTEDGNDPPSSSEYLSNAGADIEVTSHLAAGRAWIEITILPGEMPSNEAAAWANALARRAGDRLRVWARDRSEAEHRRALTLLREAWGNLEAAQSEMDAFFRSHLEQLTAKATLAEPAEEIAPQPAPAPVAPEVLAARTRLAMEMAALRQRREQLLLQRTPIHPDVKKVDEELSVLQTQWDATAPPPDAPTPPRPVRPAVSSAGLSKEECEELKTHYSEIVAKVNEAVVAVDQSAENERVAWEEAQIVPQIDLELATDRGPSPPPAIAAVEKPTPATHDSGWLALLALGAFSTGIGIVWVGVVPRAVLSELPEIETALGLPVVAVVPTDAPAERIPWYRRLRLLPWAAGAGGVCLLTAVVALAAWAL